MVIVALASMKLDDFRITYPPNLVEIIVVSIDVDESFLRSFGSRGGTMLFST